MTRSAIRIENLSKFYRLGETHEHTFSDQLVRLARSIVGRRKTSAERKAEDFWALRDISLDIMEGEAVGIVGGNGAGKSTLLKILSRITLPTEGRALVRGRLSSLLEVGTGFHPELTGRENVFLNGAILGMRNAEVARKFDEIVAFAGVEQFIDTPVKRYSSGMYVRLAFAVAAHLEPDVLIIDEVLAVGDADFQKRCLGKMGDVAKEGRTVIFVSHNMAAVQKLCARAVWLQAGRIQIDGDAASTVGAYLSSESIDECSEERPAGTLFKAAALDDSAEAQPLKIEILDFDGLHIAACRTWERVRMRVTFRTRDHFPSFSIAISISLMDGQRLLLTSTSPDQDVLFGVHPGTYEIDCVFERLPLAAGTYLLGINLAIPKIRSVWKSETLCELCVLPMDVFHSGMFPSLPRTTIVTPHHWASPIRVV